jgi:putative sporulation protein YtaF
MLILFALSLSLDSLAVGISYGLKKIKISRLPLFILLFMTSIAFSLTWFLGDYISSILSEQTVAIISSVLLILLGSSFLLQALLDLFMPPNEEKESTRQIYIRFLNLVINIKREACKSDMDHSGTIDIKEALYLGTALSIDAFAVGFALAIHDINYFLFLLFINLLNFSLLKSGLWIGKKTIVFLTEAKLKIISSSIIIFLGILRLF